MNLSSTRTQIITAAAVLLLLGGFTAAFAYTNPGQGGNGQPTTTISTTPLPTVSKSTTSTSSVAPTASTSTSSTVTTSVGPTATTTSTSGIVCPANATCSPICRTFFDLQLNPVPIPNAATIFRYGTGHVFLTIRGDAIYMQAQISKANPVTQYSITLDINGVSHQLATMVTNQDGNGEVTAQILLQNGVYSISAQVFDTSGFTTPTLVLQSDSVTVTLPPVGPTVIFCLPVSVGVSVSNHDK